LKQSTPRNNGPIWASDMSKRVFWPSEVPLGVPKDTNFSFHP